MKAQKGKKKHKEIERSKGKEMRIIWGIIKEEEKQEEDE